MVKEDDLSVKTGGKVFNTVVDDIWVITPKAIKEVKIPLSQSLIESVDKFFVVMFTKVVCLV